MGIFSFFIVIITEAVWHTEHLFPTLIENKHVIDGNFAFPIIFNVIYCPLFTFICISWISDRPTAITYIKYYCFLFTNIFKIKQNQISTHFIQQMNFVLLCSAICFDVMKFLKASASFIHTTAFNTIKCHNIRALLSIAQILLIVVSIVQR